VDQERFFLQKRPVSLPVAVPRAALMHFAVGPSQRSSKCPQGDFGSFQRQADAAHRDSPPGLKQWQVT